MKPYRLIALALAALLALTCVGWAEGNACPPVETGIGDISKHGNLPMRISGRALMALGYEYGDVVNVDVGGHVLQVPICAEMSEVDIGAAVLRIVPPDREFPDGRVSLGINGDNLASKVGLGERIDIDEAPGYRWVLADGLQFDIPVKITLAEKGAYLEQIRMHNLVMSIDRADYPDLTDAQFANFRAVNTTGMGANVLYRSSSPVNPRINRNREADAAMNAAGICTVMNMSDSEGSMKGYEDYAYTYYSKLDIIALNMMVDYSSDKFRNSLAEGLRFLAAHETPYLIHCVMGKDRTGFACALLECLMGATAGEVVADYMETYYNFYGVRPGTENYEIIANGNFRGILAKAFNVESIDSADLAACAEAYLTKLGLTSEEIATLREKLGTDIK